MKKLRSWMWAVPGAAFALAVVANAGTFVRESPESMGKRVSESRGRVDVVLATILARNSALNEDPGMSGTQVTMLDLRGRSLISTASVATRAW